MLFKNMDTNIQNVKPRKENGIKYFRSWYNRQNLATKIIGWASFAILYAIIGIVYSPFQTVTVLISLLAILGILFSVIAIPYIMKTALSSIFSLIFIAFISMGGSVFATPAEQVFTIVFWFVSHTLVLAFSLVWFLYHPRGLIWANMLITAAIIGIISYGLFGSTQNLFLAVSVSGGLGILFVFLRTLIKPRKALKMVLPTSQLSSNTLASLRNAGFVPHYIENVNTKLVQNQDMVFAINKTNQLVVIKSIAVDEPITFTKKGILYYKGQSLSGWIAGQMLAAKATLPRKVPFVFTILVDGDSSINTKQVVPVSIRSRNHSVPQTILLVSANNAGKHLKQTLEDYRPDPVSALELKKIQKALVALGK